MKMFTKSALAGALSLAFAFTAVPAIAPFAASVVHAEKAEGNPSPEFAIDFKKGAMPEGVGEVHAF